MLFKNITLFIPRNRLVKVRDYFTSLLDCKYLHMEGGVERGGYLTLQSLWINENNRVFNKHKIIVCVSFSWLCFGTYLSSGSDG